MSCIRGAGGFNNNPTAKQFASIFKKLLFRSGVMLQCATGYTVCWDNTQLECVASTNPIYADNQQTVCDDMLHTSDSTFSVNNLSPFVDSILSYIAGWLVRALRRKLHCSDCIDALTTDKQQ